METRAAAASAAKATVAAVMAAMGLLGHQFWRQDSVDCSPCLSGWLWRPSDGRSQHWDVFLLLVDAATLLVETILLEAW